MMIDFVRKADDGGMGILFACIAMVVFIIVALIRKASEAYGSDSSFSEKEMRTVAPDPDVDVQMAFPDKASEPQPDSDVMCVTEQELAVAVDVQENPVGLRLQLPRFFVVFVLKTTGPDPVRDEIAEISALLIDQDEMDRQNLEGYSASSPSYRAIVKQAKPKIENREAARGAIVESAVDLREAVAGFVEFTRDRPLVTFNTDPTVDFLFRAAEQYSITIKNPYIGVMKMMQKAYPGLPGYDLDYLSKVCSVPPSAERQALDECMCTALLLISAADKLSEKMPWKYQWKPARGERSRKKAPGVVSEFLGDLLPPEFIVLDLETTGLDCRRNEIIEIGAVCVVVDKIDDSGAMEFTSFQTLVVPEKKIPKRITEINGITQAMVNESGIDLKEALSQFLNFIGDLPLVTYNADFDMGFLYEACLKCGLTLPNRYTCALKRARRAFPGLPSYRLAYLAEVQGLTDKDTHRALGDCQRAANIFVASVAKLGAKVRWTRPPESMRG